MCEPFREATGEFYVMWCLVMVFGGGVCQRCLLSACLTHVACVVVSACSCVCYQLCFNALLCYKYVAQGLMQLFSFIVKVFNLIQFLILTVCNIIVTKWTYN